ncbi:hypothetical protein ACS0TY_009850 [Phlomoides rotata]
MKFGKQIKRQKVPEWTDAYVDYNGLKRILQGIRNVKLRNPNPARASQKRLSLFRDFNSINSSVRGSNIDIQEDIENQVIAVHTVQQENSRKLYNTKLLVCGEGDENERYFFEKLDHELNKTNNFYKDKVEEAIAEDALLKKQMEALIAFRIKMMNQYSGEMDSKEMSNRSQHQPGSSRGHAVLIFKLHHCIITD